MPFYSAATGEGALSPQRFLKGEKAHRNDDTAGTTCGLGCDFDLIWQYNHNSIKEVIKSLCNSCVMVFRKRRFLVGINRRFIDCSIMDMISNSKVLVSISMYSVNSSENS